MSTVFFDRVKDQEEATNGYTAVVGISTAPGLWPQFRFGGHISRYWSKLYLSRRQYGSTTSTINAKGFGVCYLFYRPKTRFLASVAVEIDCFINSAKVSSRSRPLLPTLYYAINRVISLKFGCPPYPP